MFLNCDFRGFTILHLRFLYLRRPRLWICSWLRLKFLSTCLAVQSPVLLQISKGMIRLTRFSFHVKFKLSEACWLMYGINRNFIVNFINKNGKRYNTILSLVCMQTIICVKEFISLGVWEWNCHYFSLRWQQTLQEVNEGLLWNKKRKTCEI